MPSIDDLREDIGNCVEKLYPNDAAEVPYHPAVHAIASALNDKYAKNWQAFMRGYSFRDVVAELLVDIMYSKGHPLEPEEKDAEGTVVIPRVRSRQDGPPVFVKIGIQEKLPFEAK